jgi:hypothetical protein
MRAVSTAHHGHGGVVVKATEARISSGPGPVAPLVQLRTEHDTPASEYPGSQFCPRVRSDGNRDRGSGEYFAR